jgi:hypothetical protein
MTSKVRKRTKLVTDQWQGSLGVHDSESCWFTEEIGTYMSCWESLGDLPLRKSEAYEYFCSLSVHVHCTFESQVQLLKIPPFLSSYNTIVNKLYLEKDWVIFHE